MYPVLYKDDGSVALHFSKDELTVAQKILSGMRFPTNGEEQRRLAWIVLIEMHKFVEVEPKSAQ